MLLRTPRHSLAPGDLSAAARQLALSARYRSINGTYISGRYWGSLRADELPQYQYRVKTINGAVTAPRPASQIGVEKNRYAQVLTTC